MPTRCWCWTLGERGTADAALSGVCRCSTASRVGLCLIGALLALPAISLMLPCRRVALGHVPHVVSRHLAPLLRSQQVVVEAVVQEEPLTEAAPLLVELQVGTCPQTRRQQVQAPSSG